MEVVRGKRPRYLDYLVAQAPLFSKVGWFPACSLTLDGSRCLSLHCRTHSASECTSAPVSLLSLPFQILVQARARLSLVLSPHGALRPVQPLPASNDCEGCRSASIPRSCSHPALCRLSFRIIARGSCSHCRDQVQVPAPSISACRQRAQTIPT